MALEHDVLQAERAWARARVADPENVALDEEYDSEGSILGFERAGVAGLVARPRRQGADFDEATRRPAAGAYGHCTSCGCEIGTERLAALPATHLRIICPH